MSDVEKLVNQSTTEWQSWNSLPVEQKITLLRGWADLIEQRDAGFGPAAKMIRFQCSSAAHFLSIEHSMPGPTGETNDLYTSGRGVFLICGDESHSERNTLEPVALGGQLAATLLAGNCALVASGQDDSTSAMLADLIKAGCPDRVAIHAADLKVEDLLQAKGIAGVAYAGSAQSAIEINRRLAARKGVLVQFVAELDTDTYPLIGTPDYILRFITERTRTINITAVGGNATLLELGSGEH